MSADDRNSRLQQSLTQSNPIQPNSNIHDSEIKGKRRG